jgi:2-keto-4-pentenoate hydratase/2-oxohepta-3-ene-1,7-dioic acid hydratase in catechol pathway
MKLVSFQTLVDDSAVQAGILTNENTVVGLGCTMEQFIAEGSSAIERAKAMGADNAVPLNKLKLLAPVPNPRQILCVGLNYMDHAIASGSDVPKVPLIFSKFASAVNGPDADIPLIPGFKSLDYEAVSEKWRCAFGG